MSSPIILSKCADWFESSCILSTLGADCEQTAICKFIGAFATQKEKLVKLTNT